MSDIRPDDTKPILQALLDLGLSADTYTKRLHHAGHSPSRMMAYQAGRYRSEDKNVLLHRKLEWILRTYRDDWKLARGRSDVFEALVAAVNLGLG